MNPVTTSPSVPATDAPRILIVDDEPGIVYTARRILEKQYRVETVPSGPEALRLLERQPHDLAIVDVRMPDMDGFQLLKNIRERFPDTEVILMTGSPSSPEEKLIEALRSHAFYFVYKPFEKTVLETLVERCLERQQLEREKQAYTKSLEDDLEKARVFQRLLLPKSFPRVRGLRGDVAYEPSERLSGDFYDFYELGPGLAGVLLADVSGHGASAALYTGMLKSEMQAVREEWRNPARLFGRINDRLGTVTGTRFVTAVLLLLDFETRQARYVSAGHPSIVTVSGENWDSTGPPLGMLPESQYELRELPFEPGERLLLYTDGLSEATGEGGEEFGVERLRENFMASRQSPPDEAVASILAAARQFCGCTRFADDATAIVIEYKP